MFILSEKTVGVWCPVKWTDYDAEGEPCECEIEFRFLRHDRVRMGEIYDDATAAGLAQSESGKASLRMFGDAAADLAFIKATADDWRGLGVQKGNGPPEPPPFNDATLRLLLKKHGFSEAYGRAHIAFVRAQPEIRRGNSKTSPDGGRATDPKISRPTTKRAGRRSGKR